MSVPVQVIGCGRWGMGDDQAGLVAAQQLARRSLPNVTVTGTEAPGTLAEFLDNPELLIIIDAAPYDPNHLVGTHQRFDYQDLRERLVGGQGGNSHMLGVAEGLELATALGILPPQVWIYVIFGQSVGRELELNPETVSGVASLTDCIQQDLETWVATSRSRSVRYADQPSAL